jgi:hypothetical protein
VTTGFLAGACVSAVLVLAGGVSAGGAPAQAPPALFAGDVVDGLPLTAVLRGGEAGYVSFVYGDCEASDDAGCAPPAEVQVWPACRRHLGLYERGPPSPGPVVERVAVRGVPAGFLDGGTRLELQTGRSTVVVFAGSRGRALRVAAALRSADGSIPAGVALPAPDQGALEGSAPC